MNDEKWLLPSMVITAASSVIAIILIPNKAGVLPAIMMLPLWIFLALMIGVVYSLWSMAKVGIAHPTIYILKYFRNNSKKIYFILFCILLTGFNMTTFMWAKPLLNYLIPFWADPYLAQIDHFIFLGNDPWQFFTFLNTQALAIFYHRGWFLLMIFALIATLVSPASPKKSAVMLTYFVCWSIIGPLIHALLPAVGPIFYEQMGYGSRFAGLQDVSATQDVAEYLWSIYAAEGFAPGAGISAMPSLHIATTVWLGLAVYLFARRALILIVPASVLIFLLSIALGWHYAIDGIVGGVAVWICYESCLRFYNRQKSSSTSIT